jgi:hypothetical protein
MTANDGLFSTGFGGMDDVGGGVGGMDDVIIGNFLAGGRGGGGGVEEDNCKDGSRQI